MSPLKFNFDKEFEFLIWKAEDEPIAFVIDDLPELIACLRAILSGELEQYIFNREKYGILKIEAQENYCKIYGNKGFYFCDRSDFNNILNYLKECHEQQTLIDTHNPPPNILPKLRDYFKNVDWEIFINKSVKILSMIIVGTEVDDIFFD